MCQSKSSHAVSFTLGALIGAGVGFLLSTTKGRRITKSAWKYIEPYVDEVRDEGQDAVDKAVSEVKKLKKPLKKAFFKGL